MRKLRSSSLDARLVYDHYIAARRSAILTVAVRLALFDFLHATPSSAEDIRKHCQISPRATQSMLRCLLAMGLVTENTGIYACTEESAAFLVHSTEGNMAGLIDMDFDNFLTPTNLLQAMQEDRPTVYGDIDVWESHSVDIEEARKFTKAMHAISSKPAMALANTLSTLSLAIQTKKHVVDIGAGSCVYTIALLDTYPHLHATVVDIPSMQNISMEYVQTYGLHERVEWCGMDMFTEDWPQGDIVILSQILHDWNHEQSLLLLQKAFASLPDGGVLLIHEKLTDPNTHLPLSNALVNLDMLIWTQGQQYNITELRALLLRAGFREVHLHPTTEYWSLVYAVK